LLFCLFLAKHPGRNTFRPCRVVGTKNRRDDYCGQGLLVLLARQKNTPGRVWQRVLFHCPYGHRKNQTYIAAKHPKHFSVKENMSSTRAVVDDAGDVVEAYDYYPFGLQSRSYKEKGDPLTKETFTGKEEDIESNLHYFGARYYDAGAGRWLSVDPLGFKYPSLSSYTYVANSSLIAYDPDGLDILIVVSSTVSGYHRKASWSQRNGNSYTEPVWDKGQDLDDNSHFSFRMDVFNTGEHNLTQVMVGGLGQLNHEGTFNVARDAWHVNKTEYPHDASEQYGSNNEAPPGFWEIVPSRGDTGGDRGWFWIGEVGADEDRQNRMVSPSGTERVSISIHPGNPKFAAGCLTMSREEFDQLANILNAAFDRGERVFIKIGERKATYNTEKKRWEYVPKKNRNTYRNGGVFDRYDAANSE
jgi:RHS repeat-associated protein